MDTHTQLYAIVFATITCLFLFKTDPVYGQPAAIPYACSSFPVKSFPFCNPSLPIDARVADLIGRLTLQEKVQQLVNTAAGIPRLGIPKYEWWSEALHGVSNLGPGVRFGGTIPAATSFPQVILTAASFNVDLWRRIGEVVSTEARAMYNLGQAGLTFWSPNINIFRDPRWGRGQETPGEDPTLASKYAISYVGGLQNANYGGSERLKVSACCKHYTAYDLDNWNGVDRFHFNAEVTQQDMYDTYQPPFKSCVQEGHGSCVMCSYNRINGLPACTDTNLLQGTVRNQWRLDGYIASDCDSVEVLFDSIHYTRTPQEAVADSIIAGMNMNCGTFLKDYTVGAVQEGKLRESVVDQSLAYLYRVLMRLGYFDGDPTQQEYGRLGRGDVCTLANRQLAAEAARQGIVLLKNEANVLPLSRGRITRLAVIGPNAAATVTMIGNYAGVPCSYTTPVQGLARYVQTVLYKPGCLDVACISNALINDAVQATQQADAVVLVMGLDQSQEREAFDRTSLLLPGQQQNLINSVANAARGRPCILVIMSGGPVDIDLAKYNPRITGILWVGYPGEAGGEAIADVIFGAHNPGGKLPMTWYPESYTKVPMTDMGMRANPARGYPGRTYRFYTGRKIYSFGYGLSYTSFTHKLLASSTKLYANMTSKTLSLSSFPSCNATSGLCDALHVENLACEAASFKVEMEIANTGTRHGAETVMLFVHSPAHTGAPQKQLVGFERVELEGGSYGSVAFLVNACEHLGMVNEKGKKVLLAGLHKLTVGQAEHWVTVKLGSP